jgi:hypothetical protein
MNTGWVGSWQQLTHVGAFACGVNIGAANGNNHLGVVTAADDSLCGGQMSPCPIRSVVSNYRWA